jgi:hypothetical protein
LPAVDRAGGQESALTCTSECTDDLGAPDVCIAYATTTSASATADRHATGRLSSRYHPKPYRNPTEAQGPSWSDVFGSWFRRQFAFFSTYAGMELEDYTRQMKYVFGDTDHICSTLVREIFHQSIVLGKKFKFLRLAYMAFLLGTGGSIITSAILAIF